MKKRVLAIILAMLMTMPSLFSCSEGAAEKESAPSENAAQITETVPEETETEISDNLPEGSLGGYEFRIYVREGHRGAPMYSEELTGERVNDMVYERNIRVEERFDVNITPVGFGDDWGSSCLTPLKAGEDAYDLLAVHARNSLEIALQGLYYEYSKLPYVDLDREWWDPSAREAFTVNGRLYTTTGDICYNNLGGMFCMFFNKNLFDEYSLKYPYEAVLNGEWTWDMWEGIVEQTTADLNGDGVIDAENDRLGYATGVWTGLINFQFAGGLDIVKVNNGVHEIAFFSEKTVDVYQRYFKQIIPGVNIDIDYGGAFRNGKAVFIDSSVGSATGYRDMEDDFGIIPFPKYSEEMEYRSAVEGGNNLFGVPVTVTDLDTVSIVIEALASDGYKHIIPEYYEIILKSKYSRDAESSEIIDLIRKSRVFDFGYYSTTLMIDSVAVNIYNDHKSADTIASYIQKREKVANKGMEKLMTNYEKIAASQDAQNGE